MRHRFLAIYILARCAGIFECYVLVIGDRDNGVNVLPVEDLPVVSSCGYFGLFD
jgi:hypothetical protein